ncbi:hypothetical protein [Pseudophaeobacter leonis]|uniref:hypothetical protein n=1 Tax=Pseudophaeobacter leonis TaxID=1144477 RepID=UPI00111C5EE0|nr:hypothetical protein [Pseudophaeobacter leonis]
MILQLAHMATLLSLAASAAELDVMAGAYAGVYAARAGISPDAARDIMRAETMLTAQSAVEAAAAGEVVKGNDSRLSDARAPTAHAHTKSQITDFSDVDYATAAQGGKADTAIQTDGLTLAIRRSRLHSLWTGS